MEIIEKYLISKFGDIERCEDAIYVDEHFACVVDGVTSKSDILNNGKTNGKNASEIIIDTLKKIPKNTNMIDFFNFLSNEIFQKYLELGKIDLVKNSPEERFTASIVVYSKYFNEIWSLGDCQFIANNKYFKNEKKIDKLLSEVRSLYNKIYINKIGIKKLLDKDLGRDYILPLLKMQSNLHNNKMYKEYSYPILDGFHIQSDKILKVAVNSKYIILASDGYPKLYSSLKKSEQELNKIIKKDPLLIDEHKSTKGVYKKQVSFDDRAYLKIKI